MVEQRNIAREQLDFNPTVFDRDTNEIVGQIIDMSPDGMRLFSDQPLALNRVYRLRKILPIPALGKTHVDFEAVGVWREESLDAGRFNYWEMGIRVLNASTAFRFVIQKMVNNYSVRPDCRATDCICC